MASHEKFTSLKFNNRAGVIYNNYWIAGVEYDNENENYSEEYQEDKDFTESKNYENEYQYEVLEADEYIDEDEIAYLEEDILSDDYNPFNKGKDVPIQED